MTLLRWMAGIFSLLGLALFVLVMVVGKGFEGFRSGSGSENLGRELATVGIPLLFSGMLLSVLAPGLRWLLHLVAAGVLAAVAICARDLKEHPGEIGLYLFGFVLWFGYYAMVIWGRTNR